MPEYVMVLLLHTVCVHSSKMCPAPSFPRHPGKGHPQYCAAACLKRSEKEENRLLS